MNAAERYALLERQMLRGRSLGTLSEEGLDRTLEEMDDLWLQLSDAERRQAEERAAAWAASDAPDELGLRERVVPLGGHTLPREAA